MNSQNICKFIVDSPDACITVLRFVQETNPAVMHTESTLSQHRMVLVTQGTGHFQINHASVPFLVGSLVFVFREERFRVQSDAPCTYIYIDFAGTRSEELFRRFDVSTANRRFDGFDGLIPLWEESLSRASTQTIDLAAESILLYTFSRLFGGAVTRNSLLNQIVDCSEKEFTDPSLSLTSLAAKLGYNTKYISHLFKEKMNVTYSEYLRTLRIKFAVSLFDRGLDSVKNVAFLSGFRDPLYFSTVFKKSIGLSPKEYCERAAKK